MKKKRVFICFMLVLALCVPFVQETTSFAVKYNPEVTKENYKEIKKGMDNEDVYIIFLSKGKRLSKKKIVYPPDSDWEDPEDEYWEDPEYYTIIEKRQWVGKGKKFIIKVIVTFTDGRVSKKQIKFIPKEW